MRERRKSQHKFVGTKVWKAEQVRKYFVIPKIENESFPLVCKLHYLICSLDFRNTEVVIRRCS